MDIREQGDDRAEFEKFFKPMAKLPNAGAASPR